MDAMQESLRDQLRRLRLSGLSETLDVRLEEAQSARLTYAEFLELIVQDELLIRDQRKITRRVKNAAFRDLKTLEDFDWSFNPRIQRSQMYDLATGKFVKQRRDVLFCAPPGTGKSHLVQAIGYQLIKLGYIVLYRSIFDVVRDFLHDEAMDGHDRIMDRYLKPDLLIIDDFGMKQLPKRSGEYLFEIVMRRYETRSTMMTTNRPVEDWGKLLGDVMANCRNRGFAAACKAAGKFRDDSSDARRVITARTGNLVACRERLPRFERYSSPTVFGHQSPTSISIADGLENQFFLRR
jgi:DNA replication protein DnaC